VKLQNLRAFIAPWLFPAATAALAAAIFIADTVADLEIAFPAFYTVVVLVGPLLRAAWRHAGRRRLHGPDAAERPADGGQRFDRDRRRQYHDQPLGDRNHDLSLAQD